MNTINMFIMFFPYSLRYDIACSSDGMYCLAAEHDFIYRSWYYGAEWEQVIGTQPGAWLGIACGGNLKLKYSNN
jgi:hypothetical protein